MARSRSSQQWLKEHFSDEYVKLAQERGYRSRAVFKLEEMQARDRLLRPGMFVVDLGAAPGGWSQYAVKHIGKHGKIIALDLLPMEALDGVTFIQGDFHSDEVLEALMTSLEGQRIDLVMSDMAPNTTGSRAIDQPRAMYLAELALDFAGKVLKPGGAFAVKLFMGAGFEEFQRQVKQSFGQVLIRKPKASRDRSPEVYMVAKGFTGS